MICPVCGNSSPDSMRECQFCSTPFTPAAPAAPQYVPGAGQYNPQQQFSRPQYAPGGQPQYSAQPYGTGRPQQMPYGAQPYSGGQQSQYGMQPYSVNSQPQYGAQPYSTVNQQQYGMQPYGMNSSQPQENDTSEADLTEAVSSPEEEAAAAEAEKKISSGTVTALLVWFAFMALAFAAIYFDLPGMVTDLIGGALPTLSASDVNAPDDYESSEPSDNAENIQPDGEPVLDALHGTWVLCSYYIQDLATNTITGGQHYTHSIPLQFYSFNAGELDRCSGSAAAVLTHEKLTYSYASNVYSGPLIIGGTSAPSVVLSGSYMCVYDTFDINGSPCYVEYALLRVFDEPASDDAIVVYAEAIENGTVALPQYNSSVMTNATIITTTTTAGTSQISATYGMLGTWLLTERVSQQFGADGQPVSDSVKNTIADGTLDYYYAIFRLDNAYRTYRFTFSEDMSECIDESKKSGSYEFNDGLLAFAPASSRTSVAANSNEMYMEYDVTKDGVTTHYRDRYISISSDSMSRDELVKLRPEIR